jgi:hypothetical protein
MFKGDTASVNPDLVHYDGFIKLWKADVLIPALTFSGQTTNANAFERYVALANSASNALLDNGIKPELIMPRAEAKKIVQNIWDDKDYNALLNVTDEGAEMSFVLPTTNITVRTYSQLKEATLTGIGVNAADVFLVPYEFMFFATDLEGDMAEFWLKYDEIPSEKLYFGAEWGSGIQYVYPEYFGKLTLTA